MDAQEIEQELFAVRYWLRVLYMLTAPQTGVTGDMITDLIKGLKNQSPDQFKLPSGQDFDELQLERIPSIERVGAEIAGYLRQTERLRREEGHPPPQA